MPEHYPETLNPGGDAVVLRYLTPHSKWSIHTDYQDNLLMLTLFRGGPVLWLSARMRPPSASLTTTGWRPGTATGVLDCRAVVSPRIPAGLCYVYHAKDRHVQMPRTEKTGRQAGTDNTLTRLLLKPTHMIGGYAQFSYAINYYGATGTQRDEVVVVRRRASRR